MDDDLVDDKDLVGREGADDGPEDGDRGAEDSDVDFEDAEDVHHRSVVGHIENGNGASAVDAKGNHAANRNYSNTGRRLAKAKIGNCKHSHRAHGEESDESHSALAREPQYPKEGQREEEDDDIEEHVSRGMRGPHREERIRIFGTPAHTFAFQERIPVLRDWPAGE